jgi:hypothetical protein
MTHSINLKECSRVHILKTRHHKDMLWFVECIRETACGMSFIAPYPVLSDLLSFAVSA